MARVSLGICLMMLVVASSVIYEAQGTFLLKKYIRSNFPRKCNEFTPYANKGMIMLVTDLESGCPATAEFKDFFAKFKAYMSFIETASASSKNIDVEITTKCDGLFKAMSVLNGGAGGKSADAGGLKVTLISMGKTMVEQKKNAMVMTLAQKKRLVVAMVKWTKVIATFVKTASEKKGKTIDIKTYELDVDVNDKSILGGSASGGNTEKSTSGNTKTESTSSGNTKTENNSKTKETKTEKSSSGRNTKTGAGGGTTYKDTTGGYSGSSSGSPTSSPSDSTYASGETTVKGSSSGSKGSSSKTKSESKGTATGETKTTSGSTTVKQVETETSKEVMSFIMGLEKKYAGKAELKVFFEKLKASMTSVATISSKTAKDYVSTARSATGKLAETMTFVGSKKSAKMKSNMETCQDQLMKALKELEAINSKIVAEKTVTMTQQTEIKQTITKWEQVTTQFVEIASSSSSSSFSSSSTVKNN